MESNINGCIVHKRVTGYRKVHKRKQECPGGFEATSKCTWFHPCSESVLDGVAIHRSVSFEKHPDYFGFVIDRYLRYADHLSPLLSPRFFSLSLSLSLPVPTDWEHMPPITRLSRLLTILARLPGDTAFVSQRIGTPFSFFRPFVSFAYCCDRRLSGHPKVSLLCSAIKSLDIYFQCLRGGRRCFE